MPRLQPEILSGDPVRIEGRQGLFRFVAWRDAPSGRQAAVIGPYLPSGRATRELDHVFRAERVSIARRASRADVMMSPEAALLNSRAELRRKK